MNEKNEFLTFRLGAEQYGIEILKVQEIRSWETPTRIANAPRHVKGVIDLRGSVVPIIDLRLKLGMEARYDGATVVIILNLGRRVVGIVVDAVSDVMALSAQEVRPAPELGTASGARFIVGLAPTADQMLILADVEQLVAGEGLAPVAAH